MDTITCPACGEEINKNDENCPVCGAPVSVLNDADTVGTPIDNSAAIDAMLRSASRLVEESSSLGLGNLDGPEEDEEAEIETLEKIDLNPLPPELSNDQMNKIESGGMINLTSNGAMPVSDAAESAPAPDGEGNDKAAEDRRQEASAEPSKDKTPAKKTPPEPKLDLVDEAGNVITPKPAPKKTPPAPTAKKDKAEPEPKPKKKKSGCPVPTILIAVIALIFGAAAGFCTKLFLFPDFSAPDCQSFAQRAVTAVDSVLDESEELYIAEAYVKNSAASTQCVFRAFIDTYDDTAQSVWFRVKVDNDSPTVINVYTQLDPREYETLKNSGNAEDQVQAAMLMNSQNELEICLEEIRSGTGWSSANAVLLNNGLHPYSAGEVSEDTQS